ncbi:MAG: pectate lyase [Tepidisphaeraceae bacterium]
MLRQLCLCILSVALSATSTFAQTLPSKVNPRTAAWSQDDWFQSDAGQRVAANVLTWQNADGGWPKNYDAATARPTTATAPHEYGSTIDNGATHSELRLLARAYQLDPKPEYKAAFERGLKYLLDAQYPNGGWPQRFPIEPRAYSRYVTYNDGAIVGVMRLLESIRDNKPEFALVSGADRQRAIDAFNKGIDCILISQIRVNGRLTAWCQQHDEKTLAPTGARAFELPCIASNESAGIAMLLMTQPNPDARMKESIEAAIAWFRETAVTGKRYDDVTGPQYEKGRDRVLIDAPDAPPIWARCYDIETNRPFFCGRDGVKKFDIREVEYERRTGYGWYGRWPSRALALYETWKTGEGK